jgi:AAA family ATP:ADP antiporter
MLKGGNGFALVFRSRYILLIAGLMILLNVVNSTGEYIISRLVVGEAAAAVAADPSVVEGAFIGEFYGNYFFWVNVVAVLLQAFFVSRIVKHFGLAGALLALPCVALGAYGIIAVGVGFSVVRWAKTAENSTDYSVMNTARQLLWLPTSREEKYKAKQAIDTFFVRAGDVISAGIVFAGTNWLALSVAGFGKANILFVLVWLGLAGMLLREYGRVSAPPESGESEAR